MDHDHDVARVLSSCLGKLRVGAGGCKTDRHRRQWRWRLNNQGDIFTTEVGMWRHVDIIEDKALLAPCYASLPLLSEMLRRLQRDEDSERAGTKFKLHVRIQLC